MIRRAIIKDATALAYLHKITLESSFLSKLGIEFLTLLYSFLIKKEYVIVYLEKDVVRGFISFTPKSPGLMK